MCFEAGSSDRHIAWNLSHTSYRQVSLRPAGSIADQIQDTKKIDYSPSTAADLFL